MPALRLFSRRWLLAGDDVPAPATFLAVFHLVWGALLAAWIAEIHGPEDCKGVGPYYVAVGGLLAAFWLSFALETGAVLVGLRGSIFETRRRAALPALIYANAACVVAAVGFNGYATHLIYTEPPRCSTGSAGELWDPVEVMFGLVWSTWAAIAGILALVVVSYNLFPDYRDPKQWQRRCACLGAACCGGRRGRRGSGGTAERLGNLFALMFGHIDWTITDMLAAFGLALTLQRLRRRRLQRVRSAAERHRSQAPGAAHTPGGDDSPASDDGLLDHAELGMTHLPRSSLEASSSGSRDAAAANGNGNGGNGSANVTLGDAHAAGGSAAPDHQGRVDAASLHEAAYFMRYAFASYGWMLFVWQKSAVGCLELCFGRTCGLWSSAARERRRGGAGNAAALFKAPFVNTEAILQASGLAEDDLVSVRHEGDATNVLPHFLAVDHAKRAVILAIRGSLSMEDVVRDLLFEPSDLDEWVHPPAGRRWEDPLPALRPAGAATRAAAHSGILEAARATLEDLRTAGHLHELLLAGPTARCAGYELVVCGHSLGAGCAFLAALHLRAFFPRLRCFAFSPPGGLASAQVCASAAPWCISSVCGKEWIPRLTLATFERMRDGMVFAAARCRQPKPAVFWGWLRGREWAETELFYPPGELPPEPLEWLAAYQASLDATAAKREWVESAAKFGPPGRVMHLRPTGEEPADGGGARRRGRGKGKGGGTRRRYTAVWVDAQSVVDEGIIMSSRMMADHMPDYCLAVLNNLAEAAAHNRSAAVVGDRSGDEAVEGLHHVEGAGGSISGVGRARSSVGPAPTATAVEVRQASRDGRRQE